MNNLRSIIAVAVITLLAACPAPAQQPPSTNTPADSLFFRDGDMLYGKLLAIEPGNAVRWQHPDAAEPIEFKPESVSQIEFSPGKATGAQTNSSCRVYFRNGDTMEGNLVSCNRDSLTIQTWYAGRLTILRGVSQNPIQTVAFLPRQPAMFDGLTGMDGWTQGDAVKAFATESGQWVYRHGAFYANKAASIARDLNLPDRSEIQFDLAWKGGFNVAVALYTDSLQPILLAAKDSGPDFGAFYSLRFQSPYFIGLTPIRKNDPIRSLGDLIVPSLSNRDRIHVDLRMSKPDHRVVLFLDGVMIKEWITPAGFTAEGKGLRFVQNGGASIKLSHLRVSAWNGVLDQAPAAVSPDPAHDMISMESGAKTSGLIQTIADGQISFLGAGGLTKISLNTVSAIDFAGIAAEASKTVSGNVRATFARGGIVTFDLLSWRPDAMLVSSPVFGKATFDPAAFSRLQFVAPEPKSAEEPKG
jgi:hypothetical protein